MEDLRRRGLDVVLVLDATSSMARVIQATKRRIVAVVERLRRVVPDLRLRVVAFRDTGDLFVTIASPLTHDTRLLEDFLAGVPADGGGDAPEAVLAGVREAISGTPWREKSHRVVLLFGDAPPHEREMALLEATVKEFQGTVHAVDASSYGLGVGGSGKRPRSARSQPGAGAPSCASGPIWTSCAPSSS
ncbi:MAG: VWA domain-containing protein [Planctomycetes bacterium]|nr:VWA domain-containing protein [Planctomycetota bacterium]